MRRALSVLALLGVMASPTLGTSFYLSPDVPTDDPSTGTSIYLPWEIVRDDSGTFGPALAFPSGTAIDAVHRMNDGDWLFSVEAPAELPPGGGVVFTPGDVVRYDGAAYSVFFDAGAAGLPAAANVDAVFLEGGDAGSLILSFDAPTALGGTTYDPADLVRYTGGVFSSYFDASTTTPPVPESTNVTGGDVLTDGRTLLTFDVPTTLGGATFLPGEFLTWSAISGFLRYRFDSGWALSSRADALGMLAAPGDVLATLRVDKSAVTAGDLTLTWDPSCSAGGEYNGIYEGTLGTWYSHTALECVRFAPTEDITPSSGNRYYLVVPHNPNVEGSYGRDWTGTERPRGSPSACNGTQELEPCP